MKVLVFLFGLFFLFLAIVPCYCEELGTDPCKTEHIERTDNQQHKASGDATCTPFCHCSNFHYPNFFEKETSDTGTRCLETRQYSFYTENVPLSVIHDFWQPPKLFNIS